MGEQARIGHRADVEAGRRADPRRAPGQVPGVSRRTETSAAGRELVHRALADRMVIQRALLAKRNSQPAYKDGLNLQTIVSTAKDVPPRPVMAGTDWSGGANAKSRSLLKKVFGTDDQSQWDLGGPKLLQTGEVHGNQEYLNKDKSAGLPDVGGYKEYDIAKYTGDPIARGSERVVIGGGKNYYTDDHYKNFAEFDTA